MATYNFRILLESVEGKKLSFISQSFVDTSVNLVLSSSQVYNRITGSVSCSYQNVSEFSGSDFNKNFTFKDNTLLSASLSGSNQFGFIKFTALNTEYDRLKRYKFIGEKVCTTLGLPNEQWIYVDQARFPVDDELNYFEGNVNANTIYISDNISFSPTSNVLSHITYNIDTGSDKFIRFIDQRPHGNPASDGTQKVGLRMGYDVDVDKYEIGSDITSTFSHANTGFSLLGVQEISSSLPNVAGATNKIKIGTANLEIQGKEGVNLDFVNKDNAAV